MPIGGDHPFGGVPAFDKIKAYIDQARADRVAPRLDIEWSIVTEAAVQPPFG